MSSNSPELPGFQEQLNRLRRSDNHTNLLFIGRAWLIITLTIGGFVAFDLYRAACGWHWIWDLPLFLVAITVVGACQHQLAGAGHEATHHILFRNRWLNEFISDWFCMFPILTSTSVYREQHLAHHQHVNAPDRDPDLAQLHASGHDFDFPMTSVKLVKSILRQLWFPNLIRYLFHRAHYSAVGVNREKHHRSPANRLFFPYFLLFFAVMGIMAHLEKPAWTFPLAAALIAAPFASILCVLASRRKKQSSKPEPGRSRSTPVFFRFAHITIILLGLTLFHVFTGLETLTYFALLWCIPLLTSFSFFMMLRQIIQHGNCDEGKYTNTRVFFVNPILRFAVFPFGMDYHLPHHLYATVPHFLLPELHRLLENQDGYLSRGTVVKGCFGSPSSSRHPTVISALGPSFAPEADSIAAPPQSPAPRGDATRSQGPIS